MYINKILFVLYIRTDFKMIKKHLKIKNKRKSYFYMFSDYIHTYVYIYCTVSGIDIIKIIMYLKYNIF